MNRFSLVFAALVAATFIVQTPSGELPPEAAARKAARLPAQNKAQMSPAAAFLQVFLDKAGPGARNLHVLFATVPHPIETHLAAAFDHNIDAIQDGLQTAGYIFDSARIPWTFHEKRERFEDDEQEQSAQHQEDDQPGILLFRSRRWAAEAYSHGLAVILISEKPTQGLSLPELKNALELLRESKLPLPGTIRILGPTYSGSFASLAPALRLLNPTGKAPVVIRSGSVTVGTQALQTLRAVSSPTAPMMPMRVDFGSAAYDSCSWILAARHAFTNMGISAGRIALLGESESLYGAVQLGSETLSASGDKPEDCRDLQQSDPNQRLWRVAFPRDISSLRSEYEKQGVLDLDSSASPWKRLLNIKGDDPGDSDSVRRFGGTESVKAQESVLLGISEFLKAHEIHAVIISATSEADRYFLTQFLHAHNAGVRIAVIGATRLFMRGSTAQFRGDLLVDSFPMLPRLLDWSGAGGGIKENGVHTFADDISQGIYFAVLDLISTTPPQPSWFSEYAAPGWSRSPGSPIRPPMYVIALGGYATWPLTEEPGRAWSCYLAGGPKESPCAAAPDPKAAFQLAVNMPFTVTPAQSGQVSHAASLHVSLFWHVLFWILASLLTFYCACFLYADPLNRSAFASFEPTCSWRFAAFKVSVPSLVFSLSFQLMAWAIEIPAGASPDAPHWWVWSEAMALVAPLAIAAFAAYKALTAVQLSWSSWAVRYFLPYQLLTWAAVLATFLSRSSIASRDVGSILNTYREMHWESGLSLVPTTLLFLLAILFWSNQAGQGNALLETPPPLPDPYPMRPKISQQRADHLASIGRPAPLLRESWWYWALWAGSTAIIFILLFRFGPFVNITSLESRSTTHWALGLAAALASLMMLNLYQFLWIWKGLRSTLRALDRERFKRSFVPIQNFDWKVLWSFSGIALRDRRAIEVKQIDCILELARRHCLQRFEPTAATLLDLRNFYAAVEIDVPAREHRNQRTFLNRMLSLAAADCAHELAQWEFASPLAGATAQPIAQAAAPTSKSEDRFSDELESVATLPEWQKTMERFLCLLYIGLIQTVVARLHGLLVSVAVMFSLVALGLAIYPFAPVYPLLFGGVVLLLVIAWVFYKVFSGMDTDPILARIVNGDDRKLQWSFYEKFAESLALPLLTLLSTLLPGGASRLLDLARVIFSSHGQ